MKRLLLGLSLVIGIWSLSPTSEADARGWSRHGHHAHSWTRHHRRGFAAPELDPNAAGSAMVLLLGGVAYIASRRRDNELA
jgi:hypothetical protein